MKGIAPSLILGLVTLSACASSGSREIQPLGEPLDRFRSVHVAVGTMEAEPGEEIADLEREVVERLESLELFSPVTSGSTPADATETLLIRLLITNFEPVSGTSRFMMGAMAGKGRISLRATFSDLASKETLGTTLFEAETGQHGFAGGTGTVLKNVAKEIVKYVEENHTGTHGEG